MPWIKDKKKTSSNNVDFNNIKNNSLKDKKNKEEINSEPTENDLYPHLQKKKENNNFNPQTIENDLKDALVIDDEPDFLELYETILSPLKLFRNVVTASDGAQAYKKIQNQEFSIIIMDLNMPKMDGMKLLSSLNSSDYLKNLNGKRPAPILLVSGNLDGDIAQQALKYKVKHILTKPFGKDDLIAKVKEVLK